MSQYSSESQQPPTNIDIILHYLTNGNVIDGTKINIPKLADHCAKHGLAEMNPIELVQALSLSRDMLQEKGVNELSFALPWGTSTPPLSHELYVELVSALAQHEVPISKITANVEATKEQIQGLNAMKGVINNAYYTAREDQLCHNFVRIITPYINDPTSFLTEAKLQESISEASAQINTPTRRIFPQEALRIISTFPSWPDEKMYRVAEDALAPKKDIIESVQNLYHQQKIQSKVYSLKQSDDLYFHMVKITDLNATQWKRYMTDHCDTAGLVDGIQAFKESLAYHDNPKTDVWVAYASSKENLDPNAIIEGDPEMVVTVTTSENSPFTSHMGIQRLPANVKHNNISPHLHAFAARIMLGQYPDKPYMMNVPTLKMRDIMSEAFRAQDMSNAVHLYDTKPGVKRADRETLLAELNDELSQSKAIFQDRKERGGNRQHIEDNLLRAKKELALFYQREDIANGKNFIPVTVELVDGSMQGSEIFNFVIKDKDGRVIYRITPEEQHEEFKWFFEHSAQYRYYQEDKLLTVELDKLAILAPLEMQNLKHLFQTDLMLDNMQPLGIATFYRKSKLENDHETQQIILSSIKEYSPKSFLTSMHILWSPPQSIEDKEHNTAQILTNIIGWDKNELRNSEDIKEHLQNKPNFIAFGMDFTPKARDQFFDNMAKLAVKTGVSFENLAKQNISDEAKLSLKKSYDMHKGIEEASHAMQPFASSASTLQAPHSTQRPRSHSM